MTQGFHLVVDNVDKRFTKRPITLGVARRSSVGSRGACSRSRVRPAAAASPEPEGAPSLMPKATVR